MSAGTILIADDEPSIRAYLRAILKVEGFTLLEAADGVDALQQVQQRGEPVDLLLTDIRMPRMDGIALARSVVEAHPKTPVLYISAYPFNVEEERTKHPSRACAFLAKPFTRKTLLAAVQKCLDTPQTRAAG